MCVAASFLLPVSCHMGLVKGVIFHQRYELHPALLHVVVSDRGDNDAGERVSFFPRLPRLAVL